MYIILIRFKYLNKNGLVIVHSALAYFNNVPDSILIVTTDLKVKLSWSVNRSPEDGSRTNFQTVVCVRCTSKYNALCNKLLLYGGNELRTRSSSYVL